MTTPQQTGISLGTWSQTETRPLSGPVSSHLTSRSFQSIMSRAWASAWIGLSVLACAASLAWMMTAPSDQAVPEQTGGLYGISERLVVGGMGALISLAIAFFGLLFWPRAQTIRVPRHQPSLSTYDSVTGLPTQRLFLALLSQALSRIATTRRVVAVLVVELEEFRPLASSPAVQQITLVVRVQAARIKSALQSHDAVARVGERSFAVMLDNLDSAQPVWSVASAIQTSMSLPLLVEGQELLLSCRIGGVVAPFDGAEADLLLDAASRLVSERQPGDTSIKFLSDLSLLSTPVRSYSTATQTTAPSRQTSLISNR